MARDTETFEPNEAFRGRLYNARAIKDYCLAGNATITMRSTVTEARYTYKIRIPKPKPDDPPDKKPIWFVSVMVGSDNENSFEYLGNIRENLTYDHGKKSWIIKEDVRETAFAWFWAQVRRERQKRLDQVEVWHEGRCGKCGRKLTVPESISDGYGPECARRRGLQRAATSPPARGRKRKGTGLERDSTAGFPADPSEIEEFGDQ